MENVSILVSATARMSFDIVSLHLQDRIFTQQVNTCQMFCVSLTLARADGQIMFPLLLYLDLVPTV